MKNNRVTSLHLILLGSLLLNIGLQAQNEDAVIANFKVFSYFNDGITADTLAYHPETPVSGPIVYREDSLEVFTDSGAFELTYLPFETAIFAGVWVDQNANGIFEKEEQVFSGTAKDGILSDGLTLPIFEGSRNALVAISQTEDVLTDPQKIIINEHVSSLQFIIRAGPPGLTMDSKKDTRDTTENYCMTIPMEMISGPGYPCIVINEWQIDYPPGVSAQVNANVSLVPAGTVFSLGTIVNSGDYVEFELDFSSFSINDGEQVDFTCFYTYCDYPDSTDSVIFTFTKDCLVNSTNDPDKTASNIHDLKVWPNPLRSQATIAFELPFPGQVQLLLFDINGQIAERLESSYFLAGKHLMTHSFDSLPPGIYSLQLRTERGISSKEIIVLSP